MSYVSREEFQEAFRVLRSAINAKAYTSAVPPPSGIHSFTDLDDVPSAYTANADRYIKVNAATDALEFGRRIFSSASAPGVGDGDDGDLWFQYTTGAISPTFDHLHLTHTIMCGDLTDGYIPYHVSDAAGLANSIFSSWGTYGVVGGELIVQGQLDHTYNLAVLNKAADAYLAWATRNTAGAESVMDLSRIGTIAGPITLLQNSDTITLSHDGSDAYFKTSDGSFVFQTDEGTDTSTVIAIYGKGTGSSYLRLFDQDDAEYLEIIGADNRGYIRTMGASPGAISLQYNISQGIYCWEAITSGNPEFRVYGWDSGASAVKYGSLYVDSLGMFEIFGQKGMYVTGGTGASAELNLTSTGHATKGKIYFGASSAYDEANTRLGIGTTGPNQNLVVNRTLTNAHWDALAISNDGSWSTAQGKHANIIFTDNPTSGHTVAAIGATYIAPYGRIDFHSFYNNGYGSDDVVVMSVDGSGSVLIGATAAVGSEKLRVDGDVYIDHALIVASLTDTYLPYHASDSLGILDSTLAYTAATKTYAIASSEATATSLFSASHSAVVLADGSGNTGTSESFEYSYEAVKITIAADCTSRTFSIRAKRTGTITNPTASIGLYIYSDSAGSPGAYITAVSGFKYGTLTTSFAEYYFTVIRALTAGTSYWFIPYQTAAPTGGTVELDSINSGTGKHAYSSNGSTWTVEDGKTLWYKLKGATGTAGVYGYSENKYGIYGKSFSSVGVYGESQHSYGVYGVSSDSAAIFGSSTSGNGVAGQSVYGYGVQGTATNNYSGYFSRNTATPAVAVPVFYILQDHASDPNAAARITCDGAGNILELYDGANEAFAFKDGGNFTVSLGAILINTASLIGSEKLRVNGDAYFDADVSALTFTDRTPYPRDVEEAWAAINSMSGDGKGGLYHHALHPFVRAEIKTLRRGEGLGSGEAIEGVEYGRNMSATLSAAIAALQDLADENERLKERLAKLERAA